MSSGKGTSAEDLPPSDWPVSRAMEAFPQLMSDVGGPRPFGQGRPWTDSPELKTKLGGVSHGKQGSE